MTMRVTFPLLILTTFLSACNPAPGNRNSMRILSEYNPEFTTLQQEQAKADAMKSQKKLGLSPGKYCASFETQQDGQNVSGRIELNIASDNRFLMGMRYVAGQTVWSRTQGGIYAIKGNALTLMSASGSELTYVVKTITPNIIDIWGNLPLSREACQAEPLRDSKYRDAVDVIKKDLKSPYPWK